jgi:surfactin synthase thioesterase subunit
MSSNNKRVVYAFPHLGAGAAIYNSWVNLASEEEELLLKPIEMPGRGTLGSEELIHDLDVLVGKLADDIHIHYSRFKGELDEWITFGHSFGGVISIAVCQALEKKYGMCPVFSIISASPAPYLQKEENFHLLSDEQILQKVRDDKGTPDVLLNQPSIAKRIIKQLRTDYIIKSQFSNLKDLLVKHPLKLITALDDIDVPCEDVLAWENHSSEEVFQVKIEGDHFAVYQHWDIVKYEMLREINSEQLVF